MVAPPQKFQHRLVAELAALSLRLEEAFEGEVAELRKEMEQRHGVAAKQAEMEQCRGVEALQQEVLRLQKEVEFMQRSRPVLQDPLPIPELQSFFPWEFHEAMRRAALGAEAQRTVPSVATVGETLDRVAAPKPPMEATCGPPPMKATSEASPMEVYPWAYLAEPAAQSRAGHSADADYSAPAMPVPPAGASCAQSFVQRAEIIADRAAALKPSNEVTALKRCLDLQVQVYEGHRHETLTAALLLARQASPKSACQAQPPSQSSLGYADWLATSKPATEVPLAVERMRLLGQKLEGQHVGEAFEAMPAMELIPARARQPEPRTRSRGVIDDGAPAPKPSPLTASPEEAGFATGDEGEDVAGPDHFEDSELSEAPQNFRDSEGHSETASQASQPRAGLAATLAASPAEPSEGEEGDMAAAPSGTPEWGSLQGEVVKREERRDAGLDPPKEPWPAPVAGAEQARRPSGTDELSEVETEDEPGDGLRAPPPTKIATPRTPLSSLADPIGGANDINAASPAMQTEEEADEFEWEGDDREELLQAYAEACCEPVPVSERSERMLTAALAPGDRDFAAAAATKPALPSPQIPVMPLKPSKQRWLCKFRAVLVCSDGSAGAAELMKLLAYHSEIAASSGLKFFEGVGSILLDDQFPGDSTMNVGAVLRKAHAGSPRSCEEALTPRSASAPSITGSARADRVFLQLATMVEAAVERVADRRAPAGELASQSDVGRRLWRWLEDQKGTKRNGYGRLCTSRQHHERRFIQHLAEGVAPLEAVATFTDRILTEALTYGKNVALYETPCRSDALTIMEQVYVNTKMIHCVRPGQDEDEDGSDSRSPSSVKEASSESSRCAFEWGKSHPDRYLKVVCPEDRRSISKEILRILTFLGVADQVDMMMRKHRRQGG